MKALYLTLLIYIYSIASLLAFDLEKSNISFLKDLPCKDVQHFIHDSDGYIWIATQNGLFRYDGYKLMTFRSDLNNPTMMTANDVRKVLEDSEKRIWIATIAGLDIYNKRTGCFESGIDFNGMSTSTIGAMILGKDGNVWVGCDNGLWEYDKETKTFICRSTHVQAQYLGAKSLLEDHLGNIWLGTWDRGLFRYEKATGDFINYPNINNRNSIHSLAEDSQNRIWIGTWLNGVQVIENAWDNDNFIITSFDRKSSGLANDIAYTIYADRETNSIFVGTPRGLSIIEIRNDKISESKVRNIFTEEGASFPGEQLMTIERDKKGLIWAGMNGKGLCTIDQDGKIFNIDKQQELIKKFGTASCKSLLAIDSGKLIEGLSTSGYVIRDTASGEFISWQDMPEYSMESTLSTVEAIIESHRDHHIWMASLGLFVHEIDLSAPKGKQVKKYTPDNCNWLSSTNIYSILEDRNTNLWFAGSGNLSMKGADGSSIKLDTLHFADRRTIHDVTIYQVDEDSDGNLWLATQSDGIIKVSPVLDKWEASIYNTGNAKLGTNNIQCIHTDSKGRVWAGTASCGLFLYSNDSDAFISMQNTWDIPGDAINSIVEETASIFWFGTNAGIVKLTLNSDANIAKTKLYKTSDGLQDNIFGRNAATRASDGRIFMGGNLGYNYFYPWQISETETGPKANLTDIRINDVFWKDIPMEKRAKISEFGPEYTEKLELGYRDNNIAFEFSTFDYTNIENSKYMYMLQGVDAKPTTTDDNRHIAFYSNLRSGLYTFLLSTPDGQSPRKIKIHINPPFWLSWWADIVYIIASIFVLRLIYSWIQRRIHRIQTLRIRAFERVKREKEHAAEVEAKAIAKTRSEMQEKFKQEQQTAADKKKIVFEAKEVEISSNDEEFLRKAIECVNKNIANAQYDQQMFLEDMGVSKSTCFRKLKALTGLGFSSFIRDIRMNAACRILEEKKGIRISELAYAVGYSDPRYFSTCFKKEYGMMPSEYAEKYNSSENVQ